ncbi:hypothetical protein ABER75_02190 [Niallia taxi]|nr:hypothetical protein [Niallia taxi]
MDVSNEKRKRSEVIWGVFGLAFILAVGAILEIIAYNNHWLG